MSNYNVQKLRNIIANYVKHNRERFEIYLIEYLDEIGTFELVIDKLRQDGFWVGQEALVTVAELFRKQIEVYNGEGLIVKIGENIDNSLPLKVYRESL